jgi:membrane protein
MAIDTTLGERGSTCSNPAASGRGARRGQRWIAFAAQLVGLVRETFTQWREDDASRLAASLALYTLLSIAPILVVSIAVAGLAFGNEAARGQLSEQVGRVVGPQAGLAIEALIKNAHEPKAGILSSTIGILVLLFGASGVFGELQAALNQIWNVKVRPDRGWRGLLRDRFFSFTMVLGVAFLLLVSLVVSAVLMTMTTHFSNLIAWPWFWHAFNALIGVLISTVLFALIFKVVPDAKIGWRDVWVGALVTALCFSLGKTALAWYVGRSATVSPFGAAGSLVALTVWVYYSAQILFWGAEFAQVYATRFGRSIEPNHNAMRLREARPPQSSGVSGHSAPAGSR